MDRSYGPLISFTQFSHHNNAQAFCPTNIAPARKKCAPLFRAARREAPAGAMLVGQGKLGADCTPYSSRSWRLAWLAASAAMMG